MKTTNEEATEIIQRYVAERDETLNKNSLTAYRAFCHKWRDFFLMQIPPDDVLEISMYKAACHCVNVNPAVKDFAKKWLSDRGFSEDAGR